MDHVDHRQESVLLHMFAEVVAKMKLSKVSPGTRPDSDGRVGGSQLEVKDEFYWVYGDIGTCSLLDNAPRHGKVTRFIFICHEGDGTWVQKFADS